LGVSTFALEKRKQALITAAWAFDPQADHSNFGGAMQVSCYLLLNEYDLEIAVRLLLQSLRELAITGPSSIALLATKRVGKRLDSDQDGGEDGSADAFTGSQARQRRGSTKLSRAGTKKGTADDDMESGTSAVEKKLDTSAVIDQAEALLLAGLRSPHLPHSSLMCLHAAAFFNAHRGHDQRAAMLLWEANARKPSLDVQFLMFAQQSVLDDRFEVTCEQLGITEYIRYQTHVSVASENTVKATQMQHELWSELMRPEPEVARLRTLSEVPAQLFFNSF